MINDLPVSIKHFHVLVGFDDANGENDNEEYGDDEEYDDNEDDEEENEAGCCLVSFCRGGYLDALYLPLLPIHEQTLDHHDYHDAGDDYYDDKGHDDYEDDICPFIEWRRLCL